MMYVSLRRYAVGVMLLTAALTANNLRDAIKLRDTILNEHKEQVKAVVNVGASYISYYVKMEKAGLLTMADAQEKIRRALGVIRYGKEDTSYFWVHDLTMPIPRMVVHPTNQTLNGRILNDKRFNTATGYTPDYEEPFPLDGKVNLFVAANTAAVRSGGGFVEYRWPKPLSSGGETEERYAKISYVQHIPDWDWVLGSGIYVDEIDQSLSEQIRKDMLLHGVVNFILSLLLGAVVGVHVDKRKTEAPVEEDRRCRC